MYFKSVQTVTQKHSELPSDYFILHWSGMLSLNQCARSQFRCSSQVSVRATTKLYTPATSKDNSRASSRCGLTQRDKLREKKEDGGICQFILTIDITTVKWES